MAAVHRHGQVQLESQAMVVQRTTSLQAIWSLVQLITTATLTFLPLLVLQIVWRMDLLRLFIPLLLRVFLHFHHARLEVLLSARMLMLTLQLAVNGSFRTRPLLVLQVQQALDPFLGR
jgi:hypothetical protein